MAPWFPLAKTTIRADAVAGITLWGLVVPEGIAYAGLAGVPPQAGLYTVMIALPIYALLCTSRHLVASATSATAATTGGIVAGVSMDPADAIVVISLATAGMFLIAAFLHLDFIVNFISRPVNEGFITGLAIFITIGQLAKLLGVDKPGGNSFEVLWELFGELGSVNVTTLAIGLSSLAVLVVLAQVAPVIPAGLVVLVGTIGASAAFDLAGSRDVDTVGTLPDGLPSLHLPSLGSGDALIVIAGALGVMLIAMSEALSLGESLAEKHGHSFNARQELFAFGAANIGTGVLGGMVGAGSMSATSVNEGAGARTPMSSIVCGALALLTALFLTPLFTDLPEAALAALIIHAVAHHIRTTRIRRLRDYAPMEFWLAIVAGLGVLLFEALYGLLLAMLVNVIYFIYRSTSVRVHQVGVHPPPDVPVLVLTDTHADATLPPHVLGLRASSQLFYANSSSVVSQVVAATSDESLSTPIRVVLFDMQNQMDLDLTAAAAMAGLVDRLGESGIELRFVNVHDQVADQLRRAGMAVSDDNVSRVLPTAFFESGFDGE